MLNSQAINHILLRGLTQIRRNRGEIVVFVNAPAAKITLVLIAKQSRGGFGPLLADSLKNRCFRLIAVDNLSRNRSGILRQVVRISATKCSFILKNTVCRRAAQDFPLFSKVEANYTDGASAFFAEVGPWGRSVSGARSTERWKDEKGCRLTYCERNARSPCAHSLGELR
jgi:hypothetical protein